MYILFSCSNFLFKFFLCGFKSIHLVTRVISNYIFLEYFLLLYSGIWNCRYLKFCLEQISYLYTFMATILGCTHMTFTTQPYSCINHVIITANVWYRTSAADITKIIIHQSAFTHFCRPFCRFLTVGRCFWIRQVASSLTPNQFIFNNSAKWQ